jgi:penicillin-binding protein 2
VWPPEAQRQALDGDRREVPPELLRRVTLSVFVVLAAFGAIGLRLWFLQVLKGSEMRALSEHNRIRLVRTPAARGIVLDRNGEILVDNRPSYDVVFVPEDAGDPARRKLALERLAYRLARPVEELRNVLRGPSKRPPYEGIVLQRDIDWEEVVALETHQFELPGTSVQVRTRRVYPFGTMAAHLLGYVGEVSEKELANPAFDYRSGDQVGKASLERVWDRDLRGAPGGQQVEVDALGRRVRVLEEAPDAAGNNLVLTIDRDLQQTAETAMGKFDGSVVALDPRSGEILAMVSLPTYDPNVFARGVRAGEWRTLIEDKRRPLNNRAVQGIYPPGSTFKIAVAAAALELGTVSPATAFSCGGGLQFGGHYFRCWNRRGHGGMRLHQAIVQSCDVFFYQTGNRMGVDNLAAYARQFGLGVQTGVALDQEKAGIIPDTEWKQRRFKKPWFAGETLSVAIGQGYVATTPLQMGVMLATIINGGVRLRPQYVKRIEAPDGTTVWQMQPEVMADAQLHPSTVQQIKAAMRDTVMSGRGTGGRARVKGVEVGGKTGTAQAIGVKDAGSRDARTRKDHAWFIGFAPVDNPEIVVAALAEHSGGHGGSDAAPIVQQVMARYFSRPTVAPNPAMTAAEEPHAH